jgi:hypothetical protein
MDMQALVEWCCAHAGVHDPLSIQVATGVFAGGVMLYAAFLAWFYLLLGWALIRDLK